MLCCDMKVKARPRFRKIENVIAEHNAVPFLKSHANKIVKFYTQKGY